MKPLAFAGTGGSAFACRQLRLSTHQEVRSVVSFALNGDEIIRQAFGDGWPVIATQIIGEDRILVLPHNDKQP